MKIIIADDAKIVESLSWWIGFYLKKGLLKDFPKNVETMMPELVAGFMENVSIDLDTSLDVLERKYQSKNPGKPFSEFIKEVLSGKQKDQTEETKAEEAGTTPEEQ